MSKTYRIIRHSLCLFLVLLGPLAGIGFCQQQGKPLYFSLIPKKNISQQLAELQPLFDLLEKNLKRPIEIVRPQSYQSVIESLLSHKIDFCILGPASYAYAKQRDHQITAFAAFEKAQGIVTPQGSYYYAVLFTLADAGFSKPEQLRGKTVAFTDPASTSGALIPSVEFANFIGQSLDKFVGKQIYTGSHDRAITAVLQGRVDAAFVSSARLDEAIRKGQLPPERVNILWTSKPIHHDPFVFSSSLDQKTRQQIRTLILSDAPELQSMFNKLLIKGIVAVADADYQAIHDLAAAKALD
ncbi:phosphate/phosphite/phosphonate ABC transporter substrate-binding protein [Pelobacter seleniigenes]|uniref:phosphate/phosphite/phosphonate ABC transporter substrate-binding protein n=1 Tax=Pelobacter seleniigenes TaxID=407188 RepID=UPI0006919476|nr:phosphate/phosphite/phosphonate ABC transporter substrate-binding protein [Pelobacter seleniigenes]